MNQMKPTLTVKEHTETHADKVKGYKRMTDEQIETINKIKEHGAALQELIEDLRGRGAEKDGLDPTLHTNGRWLAEGRTDLQKGIMSLVRSVANPEFF